MKFFIDTESDGYKGQLISFAMVNEVGVGFYCIFCEDYEEVKTPWVIENVLPVLTKNSHATTTNKATCAELISAAFDGFDEVEVIADWPTDIQHFCDLLTTDKGTTPHLPTLKMVVDWRLKAESEVPHNAFYDAQAIREAYLRPQPFDFLEND